MNFFFSISKYNTYNYCQRKYYYDYLKDTAIDFENNDDLKKKSELTNIYFIQKKVLLNVIYDYIDDIKFDLDYENNYYFNRLFEQLKPELENNNFIEEYNNNFEMDILKISADIKYYLTNFFNISFIKNLIKTYEFSNTKLSAYINEIKFISNIDLMFYKNNDYKIINISFSDKKNILKNKLIYTLIKKNYKKIKKIEIIDLNLSNNEYTIDKMDLNQTFEKELYDKALEIYVLENELNVIDKFPKTQNKENCKYCPYKNIE